MYLNNEEFKEKAFLVCPYVDMDRVEYRTKELEQLTESALLEIVKLLVLSVHDANKHKAGNNI